ncbi:hypothetical protein M2454_000841 [Aequitasia blattaphilus]|uniref:DUF4358 domain-containing protein n=1 Tax=Aequitasia blattaphilus TaxID=2949332 RepID=A0ABT1E9P4_9FIRM|nr:DUF4358 domain-containing protein [Aequitasia blattaphilus]MCP1102550.1 DUF4358 domain-containing protein [Aequitasia blattaphilus]MCR8615190.1 DUF4358 domain-containing protein [Aequitasia blattaphilus]
MKISRKNAILWILFFFLLFFFIWTQIKQEVTEKINVEKTGELLSKEIKGTVQIEDPLLFKKRYQLNPGDFAALAYYGPTSNMGVEELLLIEMTDSSQKALLQEALDSRIDTIHNNFDGYGTDQLGILKKSRIVFRGNYCLFVIANESLQIEESFLEQLKSGGKK